MRRGNELKMNFLRVLICAMVAILSSMNLYPTNIAGNTASLERTDDPVLRFVVCSDIHMDDTAECRQYGRLEKLFQHSYEYAERDGRASCRERV